MNMEFMEWPIFMPQFYTAPNANKNASLRLKNEYNYVIPNSYSIGIAHLERLAIFMQRNSRSIIEYGISRKPVAYRL
jgi:hypothetical protein